MPTHKLNRLSHRALSAASVHQRFITTRYPMRGFGALHAAACVVCSVCVWRVDRARTARVYLTCARAVCVWCAWCVAAGTMALAWLLLNAHVRHMHGSPTPRSGTQRHTTHQQRTRTTRWCAVCGAHPLATTHITAQFRYRSAPCAAQPPEPRATPRPASTTRTGSHSNIKTSQA